MSSAPDKHQGSETAQFGLEIIFKVPVVNSFGYPERLILDPMKNTADPDPGGCDPRSRGI